MNQEKISIEQFFTKINLDYYDKEIEEISITLSEEEKSWMRRYWRKIRDQLSKEREKYKIYKKDVLQTFDKLCCLAEPSALLDAFNHYLIEYSMVINDDERLSVSKIKFKSVDKLSQSSLKLSKKVYDVLNEKLSQIVVLDKKSKFADYIMLEELMSMYHINSEADIVRVFNELKNDFYQKLLSNSDELNFLLKQIPKIKACLEDPTTPVAKLNEALSFVAIPFTTQYTSVYEELSNLNRLYSEEFSLLGYDEILLKYKELIIVSVELRYLKALEERFSAMICSLSDEIVNKKEISNLHIAVYHMEHDVAFKLYTEFENLLNKHRGLQGIHDSLKIAREIEMLYNRFFDLYLSLSAWSNDVDDTKLFNVESILEEMELISSTFKVKIKSLPKVYKEKYGIINVDKAREVYRRGVKLRQQKVQSHQQLKTNVSTKKVNKIKTTDISKDRNRFNHKVNYSNKIEEEMNKLEPLRYLNKEQEATRRKLYEEYLRKKYSGELDVSQDFISYLQENYDYMDWLVIQERMEEKVKNLEPIEGLSDEQEEIRKDCYREYLVSQYVGIIDLQMNFLDYIKFKRKNLNLDWLVIEEEKRFLEMENVYKKYLKHCVSVGGKNNTIGFLEFAKQEGYTENNILSVYAEEQAKSRGIL